MTPENWKKVRDLAAALRGKVPPHDVAECVAVLAADLAVAEHEVKYHETRGPAYNDPPEPDHEVFVSDLLVPPKKARRK